MSYSEVKLIATGFTWMGAGIGSVETTLFKALRSAQDQVYLAAYTLSPAVISVLDKLEELAITGIKIKIIINNINGLKFRVREKLEHLKEINYIEVYNYLPNPESDLHAKTIVVDRKWAIIGSTNISRRGLFINHELAVSIKGKIAEDAARAIETLIISGQREGIVELF